MLQDAMEVNVAALINDTTGVLLSVGNEVPDCYIGLVLDDGANACYMEEIDAIPKFSGDGRHTKVIVNTEWGAFGDDGKLNQWRNEYDRNLDENSSNPGQQL
jgi:hexokinase